MTWSLIWEHLFLVLASGILSIVIGLPLGICAYVYPKARGIILRVVDLLQTVPSLALLGIIMVFLGSGKVTVVVGITLYSLLPIVRNTCLGLQEVDPGVKEAARGMGMSKAYRVLMVEFPLAFPTVFTGIRIAIVNAIGSAVFAAFVGGGGLGTVINRGIRIQDMGLILGATAVLMVIAVLLDTLMGWFEKKMKEGHGGSRAMWIPVAVVLGAFLLVLPYGTGSASGSKSDTIYVYDLNYTEPQIVVRMAKLLVEDRTDLSVVVMDEMSSVNAFNELTAAEPQGDFIMGYDGTLLTTYLGLDTADIPEGQSLYDFANEKGMERYGVRLLGKLGLDNTYAIAVPEKLAEEYGLECISDLVPIANQLVFGAEHEFFTEEGSMKYGPFAAHYGLNFKKTAPVDLGLKYNAVENGSFDVTVVYATDGLNRKAGLKILEDDLNFFPEYNGALLFRDDVFERVSDIAPDLEEVLNLLEGQVTTEDMVNLTYEVDVEGRDLDTAAREFLVEKGLLAE